MMMILILSSCDKNRIYEKNISVEKYSWDSKFVPSFTVEIKDTSVLYNLYINVRHAEFYPYQNIWLLVSTGFPDSTVSSKRIEIMLANKEGKWFGEGLGDIWDYRTLIQENAFFTTPGNYTFTLTQNMRQDPLPGIMSIGVRIENTGIRK
jgi:gliding motility-associated lipoprotein GldH